MVAAAMHYGSVIICMNGFSEEIIESNIHRHVDVLASDEFEGRAPGSEGGEKTKTPT